MRHGVVNLDVFCPPIRRIGRWHSENDRKVIAVKFFSSLTFAGLPSMQAALVSRNPSLLDHIASLFLSAKSPNPFQDFPRKCFY